MGEYEDNDCSRCNQTELYGQLADDIWAFAKKFPIGEDRDNLKRISGCLHDLRRGDDTTWYAKMRETFFKKRVR